MASFAHNVPPSVPLKYIALFGAGALIMRGAGCTINDLWDRNLDNAVGASAPTPLTTRFSPDPFFISHWPPINRRRLRNRAHQGASARAGGHRAASGHRVSRAAIDSGACRAHAAKLVQVCSLPCVRRLK